MTRLWTLLLPELRGFPEGERPAALRAARDTPLDLVELLGMAAGLVVVTAATRYGTGSLDLAGRFAAVLLNFAIALPLLAACLGPWQLRRLRRGLRARLARRRQPA